MRSTFAVTLIASLLCAGCQSGSPVAPPSPPATNPQAAPAALPPIAPVVLGGPAASALAIQVSPPIYFSEPLAPCFSTRLLRWRFPRPQVRAV